MLKVKLEIVCEDADESTGQAAEALAQEVGWLFVHRFKGRTSQAASFTKSVTLNTSLASAARYYRDPTPDSRAVMGPSLDEPALPEPPLTSPDSWPSRRTVKELQDASDEEVLSDAEILATIKQLLINAEEVAKQRGDISLCDSLSRAGVPYPSQEMIRVLNILYDEGYEPL